MKMKIAINGKMGSGKSTISNEIARLLDKEIISIGNEIKPLAAALIKDKQEFEERIERVIPDKEKRNDSLKEIYTFFNKHFSNAKWEVDETGQFVKNNSYRLLLQDFPMLIRQKFGDDVFAKLMIDELNQQKAYICDDLRLPDEKVLLEKNGFIIIRLDISKEEQEKRLLKQYGKIDQSALKHYTEVALDNEKFDYRIDTTNKSILETVNQIVGFINKVKTNS